MKPSDSADNNVVAAKFTPAEIGATLKLAYQATSYMAKELTLIDEQMAAVAETTAKHDPAFAVQLLRNAYREMNTLGDIHNGNDTVDDEMEAVTHPAFAAIRRILGIET